MNEKTLPPLIISKKNSDIPSTSTYVHKTINNPPPLLYPNAQYSTTMAPKETISNIENQPTSGITAEELNAKLDLLLSSNKAQDAKINEAYWKDTVILSWRVGELRKTVGKQWKQKALRKNF